jgi:hypothetical protein
MRGRSYLCARSGSVCPLRLACWFANKCVVGGPYFKKIGDTYLEEWDAKPGNDVQPTFDDSTGLDAQAAVAQ